MVQQCHRSGNLFQPPQKGTLYPRDTALILGILAHTGTERQIVVTEIEDRIRHLYLKCKAAWQNGHPTTADGYYLRAATLKTALAATLRDLADSPRPPLPPSDADRIAEAWGSTLPPEMPAPPLHQWAPDQVERIYSGYRECGV